MKGSDFFIFGLVSYFGTLLTLGLALPWVVNWGYRLFINSVEVFGEVDFNVIENTESSGSAEAEMASVLFDVDLGF